MRFRISKKERRRRKLAKRQLNAFYAYIKKIAPVLKKVASATLILIDKTRKVAESVTILRAAVDEQYTENAEHCVVCGEVIPEGRQVCFRCEKTCGGGRLNDTVPAEWNISRRRISSNKGDSGQKR